MLSIKGSVAFISGANKGIGRAIALRLAREGCSVWCVGRDEASLQSVVEECKKAGVQAFYDALDMTDSVKLEASVSKCVSSLGGINILINNAGTASPGKLDEEWEKWLNVLHVDLISLIYLTRLCLPHIEKESASKRGAIINIGSIAGKTKSGNIPYVTAKHGVDGFSGALFENIREKGIKVTELYPGFVNTDMIAGIPGLDKFKLIQPDDVAEIVAVAIRFPETSCLTEIEIRPQQSPYVKN